MGRIVTNNSYSDGGKERYGDGHLTSYPLALALNGRHWPCVDLLLGAGMDELGTEHMSPLLGAALADSIGWWILWRHQISPTRDLDPVRRASLTAALNSNLNGYLENAY